jgi:hypothetical protein
VGGALRMEGRALKGVPRGLYCTVVRYYCIDDRSRHGRLLPSITTTTTLVLVWQYLRIDGG